MYRDVGRTREKVENHELIKFCDKELTLFPANQSARYLSGILYNDDVTPRYSLQTVESDTSKPVLPSLYYTNNVKLVRSTNSINCFHFS